METLLTNQSQVLQCHALIMLHLLGISDKKKAQMTICMRKNAWNFKTVMFVLTLCIYFLSHALILTIINQHIQIKPCDIYWSPQRTSESSRKHFQQTENVECSLFYSALDEFDQFHWVWFTSSKPNNYTKIWIDWQPLFKHIESSSKDINSRFYF